MVDGSKLAPTRLTSYSSAKLFIAQITNAPSETGALFVLALKFMASQSSHSATNTPILGELCILLGRYFQIRDDYQNMSSADVSFARSSCQKVCRRCVGNVS